MHVGRWKLGEVNSPVVLRPPGRLARAFTLLSAPSLTLSRRGRDAALIAVSHLGCAVLQEMKVIYKDILVVLLSHSVSSAMKLVFRG